MKQINRQAIFLLLPALLLGAPQLHAQKARKKQAPKKQQPARNSTPAPARPQTAQRSDSTFGSTTLEIVQVYKPEVKLPPKPQVSPVLPAAETTVPPQTYVVPAQTLVYSYTSLPLRPLALGIDTTQQPAAGYLQLGAGNLHTLFLDGGYAGNLGAAKATVHLHHLSQKGKLADQQLAQTGLEGSLNWRQGNNNWHAFLDLKRHQYKAYGFDHYLYNYHDSLKRRYLGARAGIEMRHDPVNPATDWFYAPRLTAGWYSAKNGFTESSVFFDAPVRKALSEAWNLEAGANVRIIQLSHPDTSFTNNMLQATIGLAYNNGDLQGRAVLRPTLGRDGMSWLLPELTARYQLVEEHFFFKAGYRSALLLNTLEDLTTSNPFLAPGAYFSQQTRQDEVYAGLEAALGQHLNLEVKAGWLQQKGLPLFVNLPQDGGRDFGLLTDPLVRAWSLEAGARYQVGRELGIGFNAQFINYYKHTYVRVWHQPGIRATADVQWQILPQLNFTAYGSLMDKIYAPGATFNTARKLETIFDIGAGAAYEIVPHFSLFARVNNLLNLKYQRWQGYEAYGINIFGGIGLKL